MERKLKINLSEINPHVRYVQHLKHPSDKGEEYYVPWRIIYDFEIMFIVSGHFRLRLPDGALDLTGGDLIVIPPFLRHSQEIPPGSTCTYYAVHLDFYNEKNYTDFSWWDIYSRPCEEHYDTGIELDELNERPIYEPEGFDWLVRTQVHDFDNLYKLFENMLLCFRKNTDISEIELKAYAMLLIAAVLCEADSEKDGTKYSERVVGRFIDYVSRHFSENIDLDRFSRQFGFTPNYFRRIFKESTGVAPHDYVIGKRLEEAKKLLSLGRYTVQTVSLMVGYDDIHYFTRLFKKREGITPAAYSETVRREKSDKGDAAAE